MTYRLETLAEGPSECVKGGHESAADSSLSKAAEHSDMSVWADSIHSYGHYASHPKELSHHTVKGHIKEMEKFTASLHEFGRAIIKSAMEHSPEKSISLEDDLRSRKREVIEHYELWGDAIAGSRIRLMYAQENIRDLQEINKALKADQARLNSDLKLEMEITDSVKRQYKARFAKENKDFDSWKKEVAKRKLLEAEVAGLKRDKRRKREKVAEIWEKVEGAKIDE